MMNINFTKTNLVSYFLGGVILALTLVVTIACSSVDSATEPAEPSPSGTFGSSINISNDSAAISSLPSERSVYEIAPANTYYNTGAGIANDGISVVGVGTVLATPDEVEIFFRVNTEERSATSASSIASEAKDSLFNALIEGGIASEDISSSFSLNSWYPYNYDRNRQEDYLIYSATYLVNATLRSIDSLGSLLDSVVEVTGEKTSIQRMSYYSSKGPELFEIARNAAVEDASKRAQTYSNAFGVELGQVTSITEISSSGASSYSEQYQGRELAFASDAGSVAGISVNPDQISFSVNIQATFGIISDNGPTE